MHQKKCFAVFSLRYFAEVIFWDVGSEDLPREADPCQEGQAEQAHPPVDQVILSCHTTCLYPSQLQDEDRQHDPVQRQEETLEEDKAEAVRSQHCFQALQEYGLIVVVIDILCQ